LQPPLKRLCAYKLEMFVISKREINLKF